MANIQHALAEVAATNNVVNNAAEQSKNFKRFFM